MTLKFSQKRCDWQKSFLTYNLTCVICERKRAIKSTNDRFLVMKPLGINFSDIQIKIKKLSAKWLILSRLQFVYLNIPVCNPRRFSLSPTIQKLYSFNICFLERVVSYRLPLQIHSGLVILSQQKGSRLNRRRISNDLLDWWSKVWKHHSEWRMCMYY